MFGPAFFAHSGTTPVDCGEGYGCNCAVCDRKISAPHQYQGAVIWCLYCGMERGRVPMIEIPCASTRYTFGITADECATIRRKLGNPNALDQLFARWAKVNRKVLFEIS